MCIKPGSYFTSMGVSLVFIRRVRVSSIFVMGNTRTGKMVSYSNGTIMHHVSASECFTYANNQNYPTFNPKYQLSAWHSAINNILSTFLSANGICSYAVEATVNREYNRNPGKTATAGMRHYAAGCLSTPLMARFMGPTWCPSGADRTQLGPMLAPWTLLSGPLPKCTQDCYGQRDVLVTYIS